MRISSQLRAPPLGACRVPDPHRASSEGSGENSATAPGDRTRLWRVAGEGEARMSRAQWVQQADWRVVQTDCQPTVVAPRQAGRGALHPVLGAGCLWSGRVPHLHKALRRPCGKDARRPKRQDHRGATGLVRLDAKLGPATECPPRNAIAARRDDGVVGRPRERVPVRGVRPVPHGLHCFPGAHVPTPDAPVVGRGEPPARAPSQRKATPRLAAQGRAERHPGPRIPDAHLAASSRCGQPELAPRHLLHKGQVQSPLRPQCLPIPTQDDHARSVPDREVVTRRRPDEGAGPPELDPPAAALLRRHERSRQRSAGRPPPAAAPPSDMQIVSIPTDRVHGVARLVDGLPCEPGNTVTGRKHA